MRPHGVGSLTTWKVSYCGYDDLIWHKFMHHRRTCKRFLGKIRASETRRMNLFPLTCESNEYVTMKCFVHQHPRGISIFDVFLNISFHLWRARSPQRKWCTRFSCIWCAHVYINKLYNPLNMMVQNNFVPASKLLAHDQTGKLSQTLSLDFTHYWSSITKAQWNIKKCTYDIRDRHLFPEEIAFPFFRPPAWLHTSIAIRTIKYFAVSERSCCSFLCIIDKTSLF